MNRIWNSVVGKLWVTILLLVSFVLFVFTLLMLEFLQNYHVQQAEASLRQTATTIASVFDEEHPSKETEGVLADILPEGTNALVVNAAKQPILTMQEGENQAAIAKEILSNQQLEKAYSSNEPIVKEMLMPSSSNKEAIDTYLVLAFPLNAMNDMHGAVFMYQNPDALHKTSRETTKIVLLSAAIAFILTTFFAFFLSSRITLPLRKMRETAFELAKGKFDNKIEASQNDEIGQLATAFNQMGRQLKQNLELINQEKEQLSNILTSMTDAVITFNTDSTILLSNPHAEKLMQEWFISKGTGTEEPLPPEIYHMLDHVLVFEDKLEEEFEMDNAYYSITISPLYSGTSIRGAVAVIRDMTEQHRLEKLRSDFIANVSHELRTPIAMLQGYSEAILDEVVTTEEDRTEMIRIIYDESKRMSRLVSELLDLARMESGHMRLYKEELPINAVFERITQKFAQVARDHHVHLQYESNFANHETIKLDEDRIEQVLTNLIDNAIRHTPQDGTVSVKIINEANFAKVQVSDTGCGIPQEDLPYVFERFYKADKARTRAKGGTGLGLAIARNIVKTHNGTIQVDSVEKEGTTFTFSLPLH